MYCYTLRRLIWAGPFATMIAIAANFIYTSATRALGEAYLLPLDANGSLLAPMPTLLPVIAAGSIGLLATLFFGLLIRYARKPAIVFLSVGITALILSFGGSFGIPGADLRMKLYLSGLNFLTAVIIVGGILLFGREKRLAQGR